MKAGADTPVVLGLIPARGGSKGIPRKNIALLGGKPLIHYTIEAALASELLADTIVSTDDPAIAETAAAAGGKVPFSRPADLAGDSARIQDAAIHALDAYDPEGRFEYVMLLQPTAPFRTAEDIDACIRLAAQTRPRSVVSFTYEETRHPYYMYFIDEWSDNGEPRKLRQAFDYPVGTPRQDFPPALYRNGAVYLTSVQHLRGHNAFVSEDMVPYVMNASRSINIDAEEDLMRAEIMLKQGA